MLSAYQCETVAFETEYGVVCRDCAHRYFDNELYYARCMRGLDDWPSPIVGPVSRFDAEEMYTDVCDCCGHERPPMCDNCGDEIS